MSKRKASSSAAAAAADDDKSYGDTRAKKTKMNYRYNCSGGPLFGTCVKTTTGDGKYDSLEECEVHCKRLATVIEKRVAEYTTAKEFAMYQTSKKGGLFKPQSKPLNTSITYLVFIEKELLYYSPWNSSNIDLFDDTLQKLYEIGGIDEKDQATLTHDVLSSIDFPIDMIQFYDNLVYNNVAFTRKYAIDRDEYTTAENRDPIVKLRNILRAVTLLDPTEIAWTSTLVKFMMDEIKKRFMDKRDLVTRKRLAELASSLREF